MKTEMLSVDHRSITIAAKLLSGDQIVGLPSETVYGLAGNAFRDEAIQKIFQAKERPFFDPLIVHISEKYLSNPNGIIPSLVQDGILAAEILSAPELGKIHKAMKKFWPGPLTFILPRGNKIPDSVTASQPTVGIRCPAHPVFQAVLSSIAFPLAAPSANRFGRISPTEANHVKGELDTRIPAILDGGSCEVGVESTIIKIDFPFQVTLLRPGKISQEELAEVFQTPIHPGKTMGETDAKNATPGSLDEHYAPTKALFLFPNSFSNQESLKVFLEQTPMPKNIGILSMQFSTNEFPFAPVRIEVLSPNHTLSEMSHSLFSVMRTLDADPKVDAILADIPFHRASGLGAAITDRLRRASRNKPQIS